MSINLLRNYLDIIEAQSWGVSPNKQEILNKYPDKIVYNPYGPRTTSNIDWEATQAALGGKSPVSTPANTPYTPPTEAMKQDIIKSAPDKIVYFPDKPKTPENIDWKATEENILKPKPTDSNPTSQTNSPQPTTPNSTAGGNPTVGGQAELERSRTILAQLRTDFQEKFGRPLPVNAGATTERTRKQQQDLFVRSQRKEPGVFGATNPEKYPGAEYFHLFSFDSSNIRPVEEEWLKSKGWIRPNKLGDPVHYQYVGSKTITATPDKTTTPPALPSESPKTKPEAAPVPKPSDLAQQAKELRDKVKQQKESRTNLANQIIESFGYIVEAEKQVPYLLDPKAKSNKPLPSTYDAALKRIQNLPSKPVVPDDSDLSVPDDERKLPKAKKPLENYRSTRVSNKDFMKAVNRAKELSKVGAQAGMKGLGYIGTAISVYDISQDIKAGDYLTASVELASAVAFYLGAAGGPFTAGLGIIAGFALSFQSGKMRDDRIEKAKQASVEEAKKLLGMCKSQLETKGASLPEETRKELESCIIYANEALMNLGVAEQPQTKN